MNQSAEKKTYILNMRDGSRQRITVPAEWKLTFGPICPGSKDGSLNSSGAIALRLWEGAKENQRAAFTGVESFRDASIEIEEERTQVSEQAVRAKTPLGEKDIIMRGEVREWVDPDAPQSAKAEFFTPDSKVPKIGLRDSEKDCHTASAISKHRR